MAWTTTDLLSDIRLYARLADDDSDFTDARLLRLADLQLRTRFSEVIQTLRQGHWIAQTDVSVVSGTADYRLPARALGDAVVDVRLLDSGGDPVALAGPVPLDELEQWTAESGSPPRAFAIVDQVLRLLPSPTASTHTLRVRYQLRRSQMVAVASAALITAIDTGTGVLTCSSVPAGYSTSTQVDLIQAEPGFATLAVDQTPTAVTTGASGTITLASLPAGLAVSDYVALRWQSPVVQLPDELHAALAQRVAAVALATLGDVQGSSAMGALAEADIESARALLVPRVKLRPEVLVNRSSAFRRWR